MQANGGLDIRTGLFSVSPSLWQHGQNCWAAGQAQLVVEGTDIARVHQLVGRLNQMNVVQVGYGLSRGLREARESALTTQAITRFRARAQSMAKDFATKATPWVMCLCHRLNPASRAAPVMYAMRAKSMEMADAPCHLNRGICCPLPSLGTWCFSPEGALVASGLCWQPLVSVLSLTPFPLRPEPGAG